MLIIQPYLSLNQFVTQPFTIVDDEDNMRCNFKSETTLFVMRMRAMNYLLI